jgi:hypothetical protein
MSDEKIIEEGYKTSTIKRDRLKKMGALKGAFAISIARANKDPLFERMIKFKKAYKVVKKQLLMKYGMKGQMAARKAAIAHK